MFAEFTSLTRKRTRMILAAALSLSITAAYAAVPASYAAADGWEEKLDRGLCAMTTDGGVYLSWRLHADEDNRFGTGSRNTAFNIYRDGQLIAAEENTTNYLDPNGSETSLYQVAPLGENGEGELCEAVAPFESGRNYFDIPLELPEDETITDASGNVMGTYSFMPADCSAGDLDGDGEYEIVVKLVSNELDVGNAGYSGTTRFAAYKLDGTKMWEQDINLGRNVFSSAHTAQFLVYDFDGDGKAEMTCQTSLGSKDAAGRYVSNASADAEILAFSDERNESAEFRENGNGRITSGEEFLTIFNGETGEAIDTISYPTPRVNLICWGKNDGGNRSQRFLADVAYLDGEKPYALYWRGYYNHDNGRTGIAGVSFDGSRLSVDYIFDTLQGQNGYSAGNEKYAGEGNHNLTVADVDGDGREEVISGAMCVEVNDENRLMPKWCTFRGHGDALHIGDYDPTHPGYEFFTVHEEGGVETEGVVLDYGGSVIDAATGEMLFHNAASKDTGRGMMANVGAGGYYQINANGNFICRGDGRYEQTNIQIGNNFRVFWDGDLYDELLNGTEISAWDGRSMSAIFNADGCVSVNGTKANPSLQADLFGDWREEVVYPLTDGSALRVFTTNIPTDYKMKSLMFDRVYRSGVAAEQTTYNQPPHIGFYLSDECFYGSITDIELNTDNAKTRYYLGEDLDKSGLIVTAKYSDADTREVNDYSVVGYDPMRTGEQTVTVNHLGHEASYAVEVTGETGISVSCSKTEYTVGEAFDKSAVTTMLNYEDGTSKPVGGARVSAADTMTAGEQTVSVAYEGAGGAYSESFSINVTTGFETDDSGAVVGYAGDAEEAVIPSAVVLPAGYELKGIENGRLSLYMRDTNPDIYAASYDGAGRLTEARKLKADKAGDIEADAGFNASKAFIWSGIRPVDGSDGAYTKITSIADGALSGAALKKIYIYNDSIVLDGDNIFPEGAVIVCRENSSAYLYALEHNIEVEPINTGDEVTFEEEFYSVYSGNMLMQSANEGKLADEFVTYNTAAADGRAPWYSAEHYGFKLMGDSSNHYLYVSAGIYDDMNKFNQVYITLNEQKSVSEKQSIAFDITFPSNGGSPYAELQNEKGDVIDTVSADDLKLEADAAYRYELSYDGGYTSRLTAPDGTVVKESGADAGGEKILSAIAFKQAFSMSGGMGAQTGIILIDNIVIN